MSLATYQFLSWWREGLGNVITEADTLTAGGAVGGRAKLSLQMKINGQAAGTKDFMIAGPSDVIGISKDAVIRTEPVNWSTTFAPNLLAHIEFYEEDLPWRYSPAAAVGQKLRPWMSLVVLKEEEFTRGAVISPLPQIQVADTSVFPASNDTWLWAHVQKIVSSELAVDNTSPDHIVSRLICPRKLEANTGYFAFVIPTFESGRLAGLGKSEDEIKTALSQDPAWGLRPDQTVFPVYYEWFFRTAEEMDFEYLASLLESRAVDPRVGKKPLDCSKPGFGVPDYQDEFIVYLEGALKAPSTGAATISAASAANLSDLEGRIAQLLNGANPAGADLVVVPPFYGQKHIFEKTLSQTGTAWIHQLNRDPAYRGVAGLGVTVFSKYQDQYLLRAWQQLETIVEANKIIEAANTSLSVNQLLFETHIASLPIEEMLAFTGPVHVKIRVVGSDGKPLSLSEAFRKSCFNGSVYSMAFRRFTSRRGVFRRKLEREGVVLDIGALKKLISKKARMSFVLAKADNYKFVVIDRPKFTLIPRSSFDDNVLAISPTELEGAFNAFVSIVTRPVVATKCDEEVRHDLPGSISPSITMTRLLARTLNMPDAGWFNDPLKIKPALAYPDLEDPMYEKLKELSMEWMAPNLQLIPNNTITLLESNRKFIEAFMVGVNVAMNKEMRWREYPTDERGSCFRQFWDVKGIKDVNSGVDPAQVVEQYKDISPIDTWKNWTGQAGGAALDEFGAHDPRSPQAGNDQLVLVIKGDLLKCFPNTTIYAVEADEETYTEDGVQKKKLIIKKVSPQIKFPIFKAETGADIKFIGFDLTAEEAKGDTTQHGWFFVLQETPGETRFGLDINGPADTTVKFTWDDASWGLVTGGSIAVTSNAPDAAVTVFQNNLTTAESQKAQWGRSAADMAYILYQSPVMIAIHANEMLP